MRGTRGATRSRGQRLLYPPPSLDLRFAETKSLTDWISGQNLITFSRASSGTVVNAAGALETVASNVPRFDHNPLTGESLGLLVEESRTNLLLRSGEFNDASWTQFFLSENITANSTTAPNGLTVADTVSTVNATAEFGVGQSATVTANIPGTVSIFAKAASSDFVYVRYYGGSTNLFYTIIVNLSTGVVTNTRTGLSTTAVSHSVISLPNGWYRISLTATHNSTNQFLIAGPCLTSTQTIGVNFGEVTIAGTGSESIYLWGAQLEAGAFPTSYIPTTSAAATRSADVASITGSNFSSWYRQDEGTVFAQVSSASTSSSSVFAFDDGSTNNRIIVPFFSVPTAPSVRIIDAGVDQANFSTGSITAGSLIKHAAAYRQNDVAGSVNGLSAQTDTSCTIPININTARIGTNVVAATAVNGTIRRLTYWPQRLPNNTLIALTR